MTRRCRRAAACCCGARCWPIRPPPGPIPAGTRPWTAASGARPAPPSARAACRPHCWPRRSATAREAGPGRAAERTAALVSRLDTPARLRFLGLSARLGRAGLRLVLGADWRARAAAGRPWRALARLVDAVPRAPRSDRELLRRLDALAGVPSARPTMPPAALRPTLPPARRRAHGCSGSRAAPTRGCCPMRRDACATSWPGRGPNW